jgi:hypothetical protein
MLKNTRQPIVIALLLLTFLALGSVAAEAKDITKGSDNIVKGAVVGAIAGTATQVIRGHRAPSQILGGAAVGGAVGAGVGAYVDYREEKVAREAERHNYQNDALYYQQGRRGRGYNSAYYYNDAPRRGRGNKARRCN